MQVLADSTDAPFEHLLSLPQQEDNGSPEAQQHAVSSHDHPYASRIARLVRTGPARCCTSAASAYPLLYEKGSKNDKLLPLNCCLRQCRWEPAHTPLPVDASPWEWVDDPQRLAAVAAEVQRAGSVALDLEHHSKRSYLGITCLVQMSTGPGSSHSLQGQLNRPTVDALCSRWECTTNVPCSMAARGASWECLASTIL